MDMSGTIYDMLGGATVDDPRAAVAACDETVIE